MATAGDSLSVSMLFELPVFSFVVTTVEADDREVTEVSDVMVEFAAEVAFNAGLLLRTKKKKKND